MFRAIILPIFRSTRLCVTACGVMNSRCCRPIAWKRRLPGYRLPATSWANYTTSCNTQSSAPEDGRDQRPEHVELIGIINKPLLLHIVCVYIIYINDSRSKKIKFLSRIFKLHLNMTIITVALLEVQYAFLITSGSILLKMRNVLDMICRENRKAFCVQELFFSKILPFLR